MKSLILMVWEGYNQGKPVETFLYKLALKFKLYNILVLFCGD